MPDALVQLGDWNPVPAYNGSGVIDHYVNVAKVVYGLFHHAFYLLAITQVGVYGETLPAQLPYFFGYTINAFPFSPNFTRRQIVNIPKHVG